MTQTRLASFIEAVMNTAIGLLINLAAQRFVFPLFGFEPPFATNLAIAGIFTVISIARGYVVRRWFNGRLQRTSMKLARGVAR